MTNRKQLADLTAGQPKKYAQRMWLTIHGIRQERLRLELIEWLEWNDRTASITTSTVGQSLAEF